MLNKKNNRKIKKKNESKQERKRMTFFNNQNLTFANLIHEAQIPEADLGLLNYLR